MRALRDARSEKKLLEGIKDQLASASQQRDQLRTTGVELERRIADAQGQIKTLESGRSADQATIQQLEIELAASRGANEAQSQLVGKIQEWMKKQKR